MAKPAIGISMYSLRDQTEIDFLGTLEKVAEIGYKAVEFTGFFKTPAMELKSKLDELGLIASSAHVPLNYSDSKHMESDFAGQIEYAKEVGIPYIITPWSPLPEEPSMDNVLHLVEVFTKCGEQVKASGMQYVYHTHDFEFKLVDRMPIIDHVLARVSPDLMKVQFDLGWMHMAGYNPAEYLKKYKGRVPLVHMKDFFKGRKDAEVGKGEVGFERLMNEFEPAGVSFMIVEQEQFNVSSLKSAANNYQYLKSFGFV
ncbi:sugar phosphate isomerase/epimerase family protein [Paenibacillus sp. FJAT-27812]|uniref:sugar phosphate isomerase/epimerase family protein n=1 Tax=Paenibacillus sp. FJAT-27812 TaxID=1684143 RepID=UPI0006A7C625|nr:TIM barrel protein [Paenibacillus sp. FJAT-27812]